MHSSLDPLGIGDHSPRGRGPRLVYVPVPCGVPSCPGTLPTSQWALVTSHNSSYSLDMAVTALEQRQQLVQSHGGCGGEHGGSHRVPWLGHGIARDIFHI